MKNIFIVLIILIASACNYLDDYSQDLVVAKSVSDLDEVLLGSVYLPSKSSVKDLTSMRYPDSVSRVISSLAFSDSSIILCVRISDTLALK